MRRRGGGDRFRRARVSGERPRRSRAPSPAAIPGPVSSSAAARPAPAAAPFHARPIWQYAVLFVATFGLYPIVWSYRLWRWIRDERGVRCTPLLRAIFNLLFVYPLFRHLFDEARARGYAAHPPAGLLAVGLIASQAAQLVDARLAVLAPFSVVLLFPAFEALNFIAWDAAPEPEPGRPGRRGFSPGEAMMLVFGAVVLYLFAAGVVAAPPMPS